MILFLDFDGVLHPDRAVMGAHGPELAGGGELFQTTGALTEALTGHPEVQIVLSTRWVRRLPFEQVHGYLPADLRERVIGSTWHHICYVPEFSEGLQLSYWQTATRYQQLRRWVDLYGVADWIAIDDDGDEWPEADRARLIQTDPERGLSDPVALARLSELLR